MNAKNLIAAISCIAIPLLTGGIAGYITSDDSGGSWYHSLQKPTFQPPGWVFGPVWTTLYLLMGISLFLIWKSAPTRERTIALAVFGIQLTLNFFWSLIFFQWKQLGLAVVEILILWVMILVMIITFRKISSVAAYLQLPYLAWVTFATLLTTTLFFLNRG